MGKIKDLTGQRFGRWTVIERAESGPRNKSRWLCRCDCGNTKVVSGSVLAQGESNSCGCLSNEKRREVGRKNLHTLSGQKFGRLTVGSRAGSDGFKRATWNCVCDCGKHVVIAGYLLKSGHTKSCGCLKTEKATGNLPVTPKGENAPSFKHGGADTRLYRIWKGMHQRCNNPNTSNYANYGGRGIKICDEWQNDFAAFQAWALANGYSDDLSIDRIDNDKGYSPDNCRWADRHTQVINRRQFKRPGSQVKVLCVETGEAFESVQEASKKTGAPMASISSCLHGKLKRAGGYHWEIYEKAEE